MSEKIRTATPADSRWANAPIALTRSSLDGSKLPAMPGFGRSPYCDAGCSSTGRSEVVEQVRREVVELIELGDRGLLDIARSRKVELEIPDLIDEPKSR
jgi:hypothetical protein